MKGPGSEGEGAKERCWRLPFHMGMQRAKCDLVLARIARRQHGVVSYAQLRAAGMSQPVISKRTSAGRLHRLHRGVYAVGHTNLTFEGRCMAAVLAVGEDAVASHRSAAAVWGILKPHTGPIDVTVPGSGGRRKREGITVHRSHSLTAAVKTRRNRIALTKPARTLRDLHRVASADEYRRAVRRALDLRLISSQELRSEEELTRSELERLFLRLCRRHHLPQPEVNVPLGPYEVDFMWRDRSLIAETDGFRHHGDRDAFERDRARDAELQTLGFTVLRFTYRQVVNGSPVIAALRPVLAQSALSPDL
jgi:very-short-patch-repair endonuclease